LDLNLEEREMLTCRHGHAVRKAMEILATLGEIYGAERMVPVSSVQIAGVSYDNLGEAGLHFLDEMASGGGKACVLTTLNPAGMDIESWQTLGIDPEFARQQQRVIEAFSRMNIVTTCTCTPYLSGNLPHFGQHIAWAESSAVCYANSVIGARTNREGGPSALAAALTGRTPAYGYHLEENRRPDLAVEVQTSIQGTHLFGALGKLIGELLQATSRRIPYISGVKSASLEELKSFCASLATYGGAALFHLPGITPEASYFDPPAIEYTVSRSELELAFASLSDATPPEVDFVSLGCPHLSIQEIARLAELLEGRQIRKEFWITTARPIKQIADRMGYTRVIEASGAKFAVDTCCVVAPIKGRFQALATDSAKACYYANSKNRFKTLYRSFEGTVSEALKA
jgi:predicted aconitase